VPIVFVALRRDAGDVPIITPLDAGVHNGVLLVELTDGTKISWVGEAPGPDMRSNLSTSKSVPRSSNITTVQRRCNMFGAALRCLGELVDELMVDDVPLGEATRVLARDESVLRPAFNVVCSVNDTLIACAPRIF